MRRAVLFALLGCATVAALTGPAAPSEHAGPTPASSSNASAGPPDRPELCERLREHNRHGARPHRVPTCSHGPDPRPVVASEPAPAPASSPPAARCADGGVTGKRIEVLYAAPRDRTNRYSTQLPTIRTVLDQMDSDLGGQQRYRFLCEDGVSITVRNVTLLPVGGDGEFSFDDLLYSLQNQVSSGLGPADYVSSARAYLTFVDQVRDVYPYGGQGSFYNDDRPSPSQNRNNVGPHYSMVAYFDARLAAHEIGHNLGAVQSTAPHASGAAHCYEEQDNLCYDDGGPYFRNGGAIVNTCSTGPAAYVDCGRDDYYFPGVPPAGTYLAEHWNIARSSFLTPLEPSPPPPPANDDFAEAEALAGSATRSVNTSAASKESGEPNHAGNAGGASVWYRWTAPSAGSVTADTIGSDFDTLLAAYRGSSVSALRQIAANDDVDPAGQSRITFTVSAGDVVQIAIDGSNGATGRAVLHVGAPTAATARAPSSVAVTAGTLRSGGVSSLAADDGKLYTVDATTSGTRRTAWVATFSSVPNSVNGLSIRYRGLSSRSCTQILQIRNVVTRTWVELDRRSVGTTETQVVKSVTGKLADYVSNASGNGNVKLRVICSTRTSSFHSSGEQARLTFT